MKRQILVSLILLSSALTMNAQTYELHNSINFSDVNDGRDIPDGITWYKPAPLLYGIYRTSGAFLSPNYQQLQFAFQTGIIIDGGYQYGKSGTVLQPNGGNVGIGINIPQFKLHAVTNDNNWAAKIENQGCAVYFAYGKATNDGYGQHIRINNNRIDRYALEIYDGTTDLMYVRNDGNIGIGTGNPAYKLDVIGTIRAREIKVDLNGADFVFEKDYKLMPLIELEKFVKEQKHLPEVAPAKEMKENGTDLGNLNSKLLQKMEEMTLYMIEQNKKIEKLKQAVKLQSEEIEKLKAASK